MKAFHAAALIATYLLLSAFACVTRSPLPQIPDEPFIETYYLGPEPHADDRFCVVNDPSAILTNLEWGTHCTSVLAIRRFVASLQAAEH